ncbi:ABC transporter ATP-binding protein [Facklamia sp. 7083-14-GEN3]|uniref:ABC transporter ATP-binding protein n=1 Tax=Facklamia sp. 7083-14-GEN3 TaxID=2973478 RepID=UPI00215D10F6|nr:sn-glycerol-3-phosphate ABC transporter ATP-binding protein UgpC [Facklamia sp. 7083-14-GEN3]MCR8969941.1 sn-glycerol-3-phosphate ABC transporter ATP-binding protein UgpC [Facklamia sp. 7083-14-GEN3]
MVEINLKSINKRYEGAKTNSVTDFNLDVADQEFIVFVGPSGCGKSTTLRMIAGLEEITEGELIIDGKLMNDVAPKDRNIAMVFQNYALYPHMTVYDNMAFGLKLRKYDKNEIAQRVNHAAELLGLTEFLNRKPAALSGGQRQRVALGRAIVRDAKVFLMDEPLSNLDAKLRVQMRAEIAKLHQKLKTTTIYVTHDQTEAMTMANRIVIMKDGYIQQIGSPQEVYNKPNNVFVASFIGSPAMNFFTVTVKEDILTNDQGINLPLSPYHKELLSDKGYLGKEITLGIRPEDIHAETRIISESKNSLVNAKITVAELLGSESMLYLTLGSDEFIAKVDAQEIYTPGKSIELAFDMEKIHFFDKESEKVIR